MAAHTGKISGGTVTTTSATAADLLSIPLPENCIAAIVCDVKARRPANGDCAVYRVEGGVKRHGAAAAVLLGMSNSESFEDTGAALWDVVLVADANSVVLRVTGAAGVTLEWTGYMNAIIWES